MGSDRNLEKLQFPEPLHAHACIPQIWHAMPTKNTDSTSLGRFQLFPAGISASQPPSRSFSWFSWLPSQPARYVRNHRDILWQGAACRLGGLKNFVCLCMQIDVGGAQHRSKYRRPQLRWSSWRSWTALTHQNWLAMCVTLRRLSGLSTLPMMK